MKYLELPTGNTAYTHFSFNSSASVFYLPGHRNTLSEHKGLLLEDICSSNKISLHHWSYYGWDSSKSLDVPNFGEGYVRHWFQQALDVFDLVRV